MKCPICEYDFKFDSDIVNHLTFSHYLNADERINTLFNMIEKEMDEIAQEIVETNEKIGELERKINE